MTGLKVHKPISLFGNISDGGRSGIYLRENLMLTINIHGILGWFARRTKRKKINVFYAHVFQGIMFFKKVKITLKNHINLVFKFKIINTKLIII